MKFIYTSLFALLLSVNVAVAQTNLTTAVDFTVTTVHGETINLFELLDAGKYVVVDFFFTTCGPCIASVPTVNKTYERFGCNKGDVYFLSMDSGDTDEEVLAYEMAYGGLIPSVSGVEGGGNGVNSDYNIGAWPTIVLIAPDRSIISQDIFPVTDANFNTALMTNAGLAENPDACLSSGLSNLDANTGTQIKTMAPNPANTHARLEISLEQSAQVTVEIFNLMGQQVASTSAANYSTGNHTINLPIADLSNGTYLVNLIHDSVIADATKLTIIK